MSGPQEANGPLVTTPDLEEMEWKDARVSSSS